MVDKSVGRSVCRSVGLSVVEVICQVPFSRLRDITFETHYFCINQLNHDLMEEEQVI